MVPESRQSAIKRAASKGEGWDIALLRIAEENSLSPENATAKRKAFPSLSVSSVPAQTFGGNGSNRVVCAALEFLPRDPAVLFLRRPERCSFLFKEETCQRPGHAVGLSRIKR